MRHHARAAVLSVVASCAFAALPATGVAAEGFRAQRRQLVKLVHSALTHYAPKAFTRRAAAMTRGVLRFGDVVMHGTTGLVSLGRADRLGHLFVDARGRLFSGKHSLDGTVHHVKRVSVLHAMAELDHGELISRITRMGGGDDKTKTVRGDANKLERTLRVHRIGKTLERLGASSLSAGLLHQFFAANSGADHNVLVLSKQGTRSLLLTSSGELRVSDERGGEVRAIGTKTAVATFGAKNISAGIDTGVLRATRFLQVEALRNHRSLLDKLSLHLDYRWGR